MAEGRGYVIRPAEPADEAAWRSLWEGYQAFYRTAVPKAATSATWRRILDSASPIHALVAVEEPSGAVGFVVYVLHAGTWSEQPRCYLEDLFVAPDARGQGVGEALIEAVLERARAEAWHDVYWHTEAGNGAARRLYDRLAGPADGFVRYRVRS